MQRTALALMTIALLLPLSASGVYMMALAVDDELQVQKISLVK